MKQLTREQFDFFTHMTSIAFVNPFSQQREQADCVLLNIAMHSHTIYQRIEKMQVLLKQQLHALQPALERFNINDYQGENRKIITYTWLFYQFHIFQDDFIHFIDAQRQAGDKPIGLSFATSLITCFDQAGFNVEETEKFIALFYQLHRGFYFISSAISGNCEAIIELRMRCWNNIFTFNPQWYVEYLYGKMEDFSTLLLGATGTGKSLVAHTIGCSGFIPFDLNKRCFKESFTRSFQFINLSQYPTSLLESELFGHKKGAFTGAIDNHQGLFARCSQYGAVFIDEIGDIDIPTQVKLLNVIQDRCFSPVGSHEKMRFSGRVISATNRNIETLRAKGQFRNDLYYRLCSDVIEIPSLQQRLQQNPDELGLLIETLVKRVTGIPAPILGSRIEAHIRQIMPKNYAWLGNVRELEQCIRQICITGQYQFNSTATQTTKLHQFTLSENLQENSSQKLLQHYCRFLYANYGTYEAVARIAQLDRRTVKKYIIG